MDDGFSREDVIATHGWLFLTVLHALSRQVEPDPILARYKELIAEVAGREPESPPAIED